MGSVREHQAAATLAALFDLTSRTTRAFGPTLESYDLTFTTAYVLWLIDPDEPPPTMHTLAARVHCTQSNMTFIADQLQQRRLIRREQAPEDRRQRVVVLTDDGLAARVDVVAGLVAACPLGALTDDQMRTFRHLAETARDDGITA